MKVNRGMTTSIKGSYSWRVPATCASLLLAAVLTAGSSASAAIVFSDDFSAPDGPLVGTTPDVGGTNWTPTVAAATPIQIAGGAAAVKSSGQDDYAGFTTAVSTTPPGFITTSLDVNVSAAQAGGDYFSHLSNPLGTTSVFVQRLFARSTTGGFQLGLVDTSGTGSTITYGATPLLFNTTYDVDVNWVFVPGANNDTFTVTVNNLPYLVHNWTSATPEPPALAAANLRQGSAGSAPTLSVDNLVVNFTAIPEPSTLILGGMFGLLGVACRKRGGL